MEDFTGKNYIEVKTTLEKVNGLNVIVEDKDVEDSTKYEVDTVIDQKPAVGEKVTEGDTVYLYIVKVTEKYPDFTTGNYTLSDIQAFAEKYNLKLSIAYQETDEYEIGSIISQNRESGSEIISGMTLKIVIAEEKSSEEINGGLENSD